MTFFPLTQLQPSQLYISEAKLAHVLAHWPPRLEMLEPVPIKSLHGRVIYTDGHTRAFAAYRQGFTEIPVVWDEDELDWEAYQICVDWCLAEGIRTIADLAGRVITPEQYETLWHDRCRVMQETLAQTKCSQSKGIS
ncbi:MAG TPA: hypothetical protein PKZ84_06470 [Anaerolineae bacterium]|nr:hypothetical protein [Anaerolineae bacterium]HQI83330.1 hypothetical protein [Anaerolineae bacterium]